MGNKKKKISVKYILNDRVKPREKNGQESYPIYIQIVFNRQVSRFPYNVLTGETRYVTQQEFEKKYNQKEVEEVGLLETIIRREVSLIGLSKFSLKGLPNRIPVYVDFVMMDIIYGYITMVFNDLMSDILSHRQYTLMEETYPMQDSAFNLLEFDVFEDRAIFVQNLGIDLKSLLPNSFKVDALTVLIFVEFQFKVKPDLMMVDWLKGNYRSEFTQFVEQDYSHKHEERYPFIVPDKFNLNNIEQLTKNIDRIISSTIKLNVIDILG